MRSAHPPALALRLLARAGSTPTHEALVGDLFEQYQTGRSRAWFWRQTVAALARAMARDVRSHKLLAGRALAVGWALYFAFSFPANYASRQLRGVILTWLSGIGEYSFSSTFWTTRLSSTLLIYTACFVVGWLVARLQPRHTLSMVCFFSASVLIVEYAVIAAGLFWGLGVRTQPGLFPAHAPPGYPPFALVAPAVLAIFRPLGVLLGGLTWVLTQEAERAPATR